MEIPQEILDTWDLETISQVTEALRVLPEDLHPAVFYLGGLIADIRHQTMPSPLEEDPDLSDIFAEFGIDPEDAEEASVEVYFSMQSTLTDLEALLNGLIKYEYLAVHMFFEERLRVFISATSMVAASCDDFTQTKSFLERKEIELFTLQVIVGVLSSYLSAAKAPLH